MLNRALFAIGAAMLAVVSSCVMAANTGWRDQWEVGYGPKGATCYLWNTYSDPDRPELIVNVNFTKSFDIDAVEPSALRESLLGQGIAEGELLFVVSFPFPVGSEPQYDPVISASVGEYTLTQVKSEYFRWFYIGEPESQTLLSSLNAGQSPALFAGTSSKPRTDLRFPDVGGLGLRIGTAQLNACVSAVLESNKRNADQSPNKGDSDGQAKPSLDLHSQINRRCCLAADRRR